MDDIAEEILENYKTPGHPTAFGGVQTIYKYYRKAVPLKKIKNILKHSYTYSLHKETKKSTRNPYYIYYKRQQYQIDMIDVRELAPFNDGITFLLSCIDVFTKKAFIRPCKNKSAFEVLNKFRSIVEEGGVPKSVISDKGSEIKNMLFRRYCEQMNILRIYPENEVHAAVVERFNKSIQMLIYKYLTENETHRYIDKLQNFIKTYNQRFHRSIGMSPNMAELDENHGAVFMKVDDKIRKARSKRKKQVFEIGDEVRLKPLKRAFSRSYLRQFNEEIFIVTEIKDNLAIITYKLKDLLGEPVIGSFYPNELSPIVDTGDYKIEEILERRNRGGVAEVFVSWKGYGAKFNKWIREDDIDII